MHIKEEKKIYIDTEKYIEISQVLGDGIQFKLFVEFQTEKFMEYQKDLIQEFIAGFADVVQREEFDLENLKTHCEVSLQDLNTKLKLFADKVRDVDFFQIKGYLQVVMGTTLISSMIGNVTVMIFRDRKIYYTLTNATKVAGKIDLFSEFIEGDLESSDEIVYVGTKISDILDNYDIKEMEQILQTENSIIPFINDLLSTRVEKQNIGFLSSHHVVGIQSKSKMSSRINIENLTSKFGFLNDIKNKFLKNKYQTTVAILCLFIAFMLYNLVSQLLQSSDKEVYVNSEGVTVDLTIDDIKKDIVMFKSMDSAGDEKSLKYQEISNKLTTLEKKGRRVEDIVQLKKILKSDYYKGFNIITVNNLNQFDDAIAGKKTSILTFNTPEKDKLGEPFKIEYWKDILIAGTKSSLLGITNDNSRGSIVEYAVEDTIKSCSLNLLKNGFYCFTTNGKIFLVTKTGIEQVSTGDPDGFISNIGGIATYGKANMYVFSPNVTNLSDSTFVTRYRNTLGSQSVYQAGQKYLISPSLATGLNFGSGFSSFGIDVNFLAWSDGKLYQFWRNPATSLVLTYREIKLLGGDKMTSKYSNNVKIITPSNSKYTYIWDKDNQSFTVYESRPLKTNELFATNYNLYYLFRFAFDLGSNKVLDVTVPDSSGNRPELFILTSNGVNKVNLYEFVDSIKDNNSLKQVN